MVAAAVLGTAVLWRKSSSLLSATKFMNIKKYIFSLIEARLWRKIYANLEQKERPSTQQRFCTENTGASAVDRIEKIKKFHNLK